MVTTRRWWLDNDRDSVMTVETPPCAAATAGSAAVLFKTCKNTVYLFSFDFFFVPLFCAIVVAAADRKTNEKNV
jgi:uncharacterized membrane protein